MHAKKILLKNKERGKKRNKLHGRWKSPWKERRVMNTKDGKQYMVKLLVNLYTRKRVG